MKNFKINISFKKDDLTHIFSCLNVEYTCNICYSGIPVSHSQTSDGAGERGKRQNEMIVNDILSEGK
jgi:hypothetical protein